MPLWLVLKHTYGCQRPLFALYFLKKHVTTVKCKESVPRLVSLVIFPPQYSYFNLPCLLGLRDIFSFKNESFLTGNTFIQKWVKYMLFSSNTDMWIYCNVINSWRCFTSFEYRWLFVKSLKNPYNPNDNIISHPAFA